MVTKRWGEALRVYSDLRMIALFFLGFSSGLPRLLVYSTLSFWLLDVGLSIKTVGLFAATSLPYNFKFLWAPIIDRLPLPILARLVGLRRAWMLVLQLGLLAAILMQATVDPGGTPFAAAVIAIVVATLSASQDIVIDAFRVEILTDEEQGAGAAMAVFGYRVGMLAAGAGALYTAAFSGSWQTTYTVMGALMGVGIITTLLVAEPTVARHQADRSKGKLAFVMEHVRDAVIGPFMDYLSRRGAIWVLVFVVLYKLGDAMAATMTGPFLVGLDFSKMEIANIAKSYGLVASILGVFAGGALVRKLGLLEALWVAGIMQMLSNLMFMAQAHVGHDSAFLAVTIGVENLTGGLGTAAFVAYLSALCNKAYTATQYALLTAVSSLLHTVAATGAGYAVAWMGWVQYFLATAVVAIPGLLMLYWMTNKGMAALPEGHEQAAETGRAR